MVETTVQLVDDHEMVRAGFKSLIEKTSDCRVIAESSSAENAWRDYMKHRPDVVIMDVSMPGIGGIEGIKRILARDPDARIIVLTMLGPEIINKVREIGAKGYVNKSCSPTLIVKAIEKVVKGGTYICSLNPVTGRNPLSDEKPVDPISTLSQREFEIMMLLLSEKSNSEIADILGLSSKTVHVHKSRIFSKLNVNSMVGLTQVALAYELIESPF